MNNKFISDILAQLKNKYLSVVFIVAGNLEFLETPRCLLIPFNMIKINSDIPSDSFQYKAVGLLSGGLDSILAAQMIHDLGFEVHAVYFAQPWGCCDKAKAMEAAEKLGIKFVALQLDERYLDLIKSPKHGYGNALNPCVDCRVHMFSRAGKYMESIGAQFVFTGEVLGQRPMSQMRHSMITIEKESGLTGRLLRPLCAQHLDPTIPEQQGIVDREKLLNLSGRSRSEQLKMAEQFGITDYIPTGGGCLLTDKNFARRMSDTLQHGYRNFRETIALKWGRHFRISNDYKAVLGRDEEENINLQAFAHSDDFIFELPDKRGPTLILKGQNPSPEILQICSGLVKYFSRHKTADQTEIEFWIKKAPNNISRVVAESLQESQINAIQI